MSKSNRARQGVAEAFLSSPIGEVVPTTAILAERIGVSLGTVHAAVTSLERDGFVVTSAHGGRGRRLVERDLLKLWAASGRGAMTGLLPLPESREMAGLATALAIVAEGRQLQLQLLFRQGGLTRLNALESGRVDFIAGSSRLARVHQEPVSYRKLGPHSYYDKGALVVITANGRPPASPRTVASDLASPDHLAMTRQEFPEAQVIPTPYMFIPEAVANRNVEAALWHRTTPSPMMVATGINVHPLSRPPLADQDEVNRAALMWRPDRPDVGQVLRGLFYVDQITEIQSEVLNGRMVPHF